MNKIHPFIVSLPTLEGAESHFMAIDLKKEVLFLQSELNEIHSITRIDSLKAFISARISKLRELTKGNTFKKELSQINSLRRSYQNLSSAVSCRRIDLRVAGYR